MFTSASPLPRGCIVDSDQSIQGFSCQVQSDMDIDPDITIMYLPSFRKHISRTNLRVVLSENFNRKRLPEENEQEIENVWQNKLTVNPKMWNGSKFRLESVSEKDDITTFNIGITSYKDFIGTNWSPKAKDLHKLGLEINQNEQSFMSDALGVGSIVQTADDMAVIIKRSTNCAEAVGLWDIPGGHPEPMVHICIYIFF